MPRPSLQATERDSLQVQIRSLQEAILLFHDLFEQMAARLDRLEKADAKQGAEKGQRPQPEPHINSADGRVKESPACYGQRS